MNRTGWTLLLMGLVCAAQAPAATPDRVVPPKRQISQCMIKQMLADRRLSYNDAGKLCRGQLSAGGGGVVNLAANGPEKTVVARTVP